LLRHREGPNLYKSVTLNYSKMSDPWKKGGGVFSPKRKKKGEDVLFLSVVKLHLRQKKELNFVGGGRVYSPKETTLASDEAEKDEQPSVIARGGKKKGVM